MHIFSRSKKKEELFLVFDVHSASVGAALFFTDSTKTPRIVASVREFIPVENDLSPDRLFTLILGCLKSVAHKISKKGLGAPARVFCVLGAPWHVSQTRIIKLSKNVPFVFTEKLADELTQKEIALVRSEYAHMYKDMSGMLRPIELKNIKTKLNSYDTTKPIGKTTSSVEMHIFISMSAEDVCNKIEAIIEKHYPHREIKFSSFTMASFAALRDMYHDRENFILIHLSGEITDITMVKKSTLRETVTFPMGINFFLRGIASGLHITPAEAQSFLSLHNDGHAGESISQTLTPLIVSLEREWLKKFQEALANLSNDISIPSLLYVTTSKNFVDFFTEMIKGEQFNQYTLAESKFEIVPCSSETLHTALTFSQGAEFDAYLALDAIYINRFFT